MENSSTRISARALPQPWNNTSRKTIARQKRNSKSMRKLLRARLEFLKMRRKSLWVVMSSQECQELPFAQSVWRNLKCIMEEGSKWSRMRSTQTTWITSIRSMILSCSISAWHIMLNQTIIKSAPQLIWRRQVCNIAARTRKVALISTSSWREWVIKILKKQLQLWQRK